jgi:hypothetical protein
MLHTRKNKESCEATIIKLTRYYVRGMWIQNTEFCRNLATEIENTKTFMVHKEKMKNPAKRTLLN